MSMKDLQNHPTPPDMRTIVERTAQCIARHGLEYEKRILDCIPNDSRIKFSYNFLKSSEDPLHGYYQQKLAEYLSKPQEIIIDTPASTARKDIIMVTAFQISQKGLEDEKEMMESFAKRPGNFSFLNSSHRHHAFFRNTLTQYRSQNQQNGANHGHF